MHRVSTIFLMMFSLLFGSCKPAANQLSRASTVDQLVDNRNRNDSEQCGKTIAGPEDLPNWLAPYADRVKAQSDSLQLEALGTLTHAPPLLATYFFLFRGNVWLHPQAAQICSDAKVTTEERNFVAKDREIDACWLRMNESIMVVLPPDPNRIRGQLLRLITYVFVERIVPLMAVSNDPAIKHVAKSFAFYRRQLASALMQDLGQNGGSTKYQLLAREHPETFTKFVFAETLDSQFCNDETQRAANARFPTLMGALRGNQRASLLRDLQTVRP